MEQYFFNYSISKKGFLLSLIIFIIMIVAIVVLYFYLPNKFSALLIVTVVLALLSLKLLFATIKIKYYGGVMLNKDCIELSGLLFKTKISTTDIISSEVINLNESVYRIKYKKSGINIPDFLYGWFFLKNGDEAYVIISNNYHGVVKIETSSYPILLSLGDAQGFVDNLQKIIN